MTSVLRRIAVDCGSQATARFCTEGPEIPLRSMLKRVPRVAEKSQPLIRGVLQLFQADLQLDGVDAVGGAHSKENVRQSPGDGHCSAASLVARPRDDSSTVFRGSLPFPGLLGRKCTSALGDCNVAEGVFAFSRSYAAKAKKSKSRRDETADADEDVTESAKQRAAEMMDSALDVLSVELSKLRTGRASPGMLDHITVVSRGVRTPLSHIAAVSLNGVQSLSVLPYDASLVKEVEKALINSPLGLNPQVDGVTLTVPIPRLTKEHRETMCTLVGKAGECTKLAIRRARKEALDQAKKGGSLSKDETRTFEKEVDELTKKRAKTIDDVCKAKEKEIMA